MPYLSAIAYLSSATRTLTSADLDHLLREARSFNEFAHVTGALLYNDGTFFQYIEGSPTSLEIVYLRIRNARSHHNIHEVFRGTAVARLFPDWHMGFAEAPASQLQQLAQARWESSLASLDEDIRAREGARLLLGFWSSARR